jgi:hypothetical protein
MKAINGLLVSLVAGTCASAALAGGDDVTKALTPKKVEKVRMVGNLNGGFGQRAALMDYYANNDLGGGSFIFYGLTVHTSGEPIVLEKQGTNDFNNPVGPVGSASKVGEYEFWVVASDGTTGSHGVDCTVTTELFSETVDWLPVGSTCMGTGTGELCADQVNRVSLGGFYVDLNGSFAPLNGFANGYILDLATAGLPWNSPDPTAFIDIRMWEYNGGNPPTTLSSFVYNTYDGSSSTCAYAPGGYPLVGYSADNFYFDADLTNCYGSNERYFYGGPPFVANTMVRLSGDDGCSYDLNGDGFVTGDDTDYGNSLNDAGCPF